MRAAHDPDAINALSVAEQYDPVECQSSEASWLPVTWSSQPSWQLPIRDQALHKSIQKSKHLLLNPNYSISEIASELGFKSSALFSVEFTRIAGETPRAYRARMPRLRQRLRNTGPRACSSRASPASTDPL
jgi:hypothetical protein